MSRFFQHDSDSDSSSTSSASSSSSSEILIKGRLKADYSDSESEEEVKRIVRSTKDKRFDELRGYVRSLENAQKINDWVTVSAGWCLPLSLLIF